MENLTQWGLITEIEMSKSRNDNDIQFAQK
jgi:hypothetical protein